MTPVLDPDFCDTDKFQDCPHTSGELVPEYGDDGVPVRLVYREFCERQCLNGPIAERVNE